MKTAAGAVLSLSAISANAGIIIPAGDWTLDVSGNVNMYSSWSKISSGSTNPITGGLVNPTGALATKTSNGMGNGLLPNFLSFSGSTRQNDLDVSFTISLQPGSANNSALTTGAGGGTNTAGIGGINNRQSFITVGDKSWGSVKIGKDLGIFASDAILNDMTLLGVGGAAAGGGNTSLGRIGFGYIYADWKPQIAYTTPNFSGFQATAGITQAFNSQDNGTNPGYLSTNANVVNANVAYEGKASYSFAANDVNGKIWVSGLAQHVGTPGADSIHGNADPMAYAGDIGANAKVAGFDLTGYYYYGSGVGTTGQMLYGYGLNGVTNQWEARDSYGGYVQAQYTLPTKTKVGISWGESKLDNVDNAGTWSGYAGQLVSKNEMWDAMLMHPLTKHLNLIAEYSYQKSTNHDGASNDSNTGSLGAILFF